MTFTDDADNAESLTSVATVAVAAKPNSEPTGLRCHVLAKSETIDRTMTNVWCPVCGVEQWGATLPPCTVRLTTG